MGITGTGSATNESRVIVGYRDGVMVLGLVGDQDANTARDLARVIKNSGRHSSGVVVSFSEADLVDHAIVRALFLADRTMLTRGQRLVLHANGDMACDRALELLGVHQELLCCESLDEAITFAAQQGRDTA